MSKKKARLGRSGNDFLRYSGSGKTIIFGTLGGSGGPLNDCFWEGRAVTETYNTNLWIDLRWLQVYNWRHVNGVYVPNSRWQWLPVAKLQKWFRHKSRQGVLCFASTARYLKQNKESPQLSNFCADFDADSDDDFPRIVNSVGFITEFFEKRQVSRYDLRVWFSGRRSYHLEIPYQFFGIEPTVRLNRYWKFVAETINDQIPGDCYPLDLNLYSNPRMFRLPNSYYPEYDTYKVELKPDEIHLPIKDIREMAREPRESLTQEMWEMTDDELFESYETYEYASAWWHNEVVPTVDEIEAEREEIPVDPQAIKAMVDVPVCIKDLRLNAAERLQAKGTANKAQIHDATYSLAKGVPESEAVTWIESWIHSARPEYQNTASVVKTIYANPSKYKLSCGLAWHLGLKCAKEACPLYRKHDLRKHSQRVRVVPHINWIPPSEDAVRIDEARHQLGEHFSDWLTDWWISPNSDIQAYTLPPGGGKTITPLKALEAGIVSHTLYFAPSHAILDEQEAGFPHFYHVRSRSADANLCIMPEVCDAYAVTRYNAVKAVCLATCEKQFDCAYRWQFVPRDTVLTHEYLFSPTFMDWLAKGVDCDGNPPEGLNSWVVIIDEPSISTFIETVNITNSTLTKAMNQTQSEAVRKLLEVVRTAIETACNGNDKPVRMIGEGALSLIAETAKTTGTDLAELVSAARCVIDEDKAPRIRVAFDAVRRISENGKSICLSINGEEVWLPAKEIEFDEAAKVVIMPQWLAESNQLSGMAELNVVEVDTEASEKKELLLNFIADLLRCLEADLAKDKPFNSPLVITRMFRLPTLRLNLKKPFDHVHGPIVMLDACATPQLLEALTGRNVTSWRVPLKMESETIIQATDGYYGITSLWQKESSAPRRTVKRIMKAVQQIIDGKEAQTLIVTWKALAQYLIGLQEKGQLDNRLTIVWYGGIEGLNAYENLAQVILVGTPSVPKDDIIEMAQAIWANDPTPLNPEIRWVWRRYAYRDTDGNGMEAKVWEFVDERLNMILHNYREHEIIQAAHRIRPLLHAGKRIYLLSNLPINELPPTQLTTLDELAGEATPAGYDEFVAVCVQILDKYTGVWGNLMEGVCDEKSSIFTLVINYISYNNGENAKKLSGLSRPTITRWLSKAASQLDLASTQVVFGKGLSVKVWHRPGEFDEAKIRRLWEEAHR